MNKRSTVLRVGREALSRAGAFYRSYLFPAIVIGATMFYLANILRSDMSMKDHATEWQRAYKIVMCIHGLALFNKVLEKRPLELRILFLNVVWLFLARCITEKYTLKVNDECWWAIVLLLSFASGYFLDKKRRELLLTCITLELVAVTAVWGAVAIVTAINRVSVVGFELIKILVRNIVPLDEYVQIYTYRTIISAYYFICAGMVLYKCILTKAVRWRVVAVIYLPLSFVAIALQDCQSISVCYCLLLGMFIFIAVFKRTLLGKLRRRRLVFSGCWLLCAVLLFASLGLCHNVFLERIGAHFEIPKPAASAASSAPAPVAASKVMTIAAIMPGPIDSRLITAEAVPTAQKNKASEPRTRGSLQSILSLSGRTSIWSATIPTLRDNKKMVIFGQPEAKAMKAINAHIVYETGKVRFDHMHNTLLQQLVVAGIPGLRTATCTAFA